MGGVGGGGFISVQIIVSLLCNDLQFKLCSHIGTLYYDGFLAAVWRNFWLFWRRVGRGNKVDRGARTIGHEPLDVGHGPRVWALCTGPGRNP